MPDVVITMKNGKPKATHDQLDLTGLPSDQTINFSFDSTVTGYRFKTQAEDATYGVDFSGNPPAGTFSQWSANDAQTPTVVTCVAANTDSKTWNYKFHLVALSTGETVECDPSIKDN